MKDQEKTNEIDSAAAHDALQDGGDCDRDALTPAAAMLRRGVQRMLRTENYESVAELVLASGRRADVFALGPTGDMCIVEIKSSVADFRADHKWHTYRDYCDTLYFAVAPDFPIEILPVDVGIIVADGYGGERVRICEVQPVSGARRKALLVRFARSAAMRLTTLIDPAGHSSRGRVL